MKRVRLLLSGAMGGMLLVLLLWGCGGHQPQPAAQPTKQRVQGDSDRFFEKLHQEEQERGHGQQAPGQ